MKYFLVIYTFLILHSCSLYKTVTDDQVIGRYQWNGFYDVNASINLKDNKTFEYHWQEDLNRGLTVGTWKNNDGVIILNSNLQQKLDELTTHIIIYSVSLSIKVLNSDDKPRANAFKLSTIYQQSQSV